MRGDDVGTVVFYHLTRSSAVQTLHAILPRALQAQWRVQIRADAPVLADLDAKLWQGDASVFIPHGLAGGAHDADQPILLGNLPCAGFDALVLLGAAALELAVQNPSEAQLLQRVWVLFDAKNDSDMMAARALWRAVSAAGLHAQYHSEESGRWALKTTANAPAAP